MSQKRFSRATLPVNPWKNGGGETREIACWPPGAGLDNFDWRVSIATIGLPGPFSVFAGVDRLIMLVDGDGIRLRSADESIDHHLDTAYQPFAFSGDAEIDCTLLGGTSSDFNVMTRRGTCYATLQVLARAADLAPAAQGVLLALRGRWQLGPDHCLDVDEGMVWSGMPQAWRVKPHIENDTESRLVAVRLSPMKPKEAGFMPGALSVASPDLQYPS